MSDRVAALTGRLTPEPAGRRHDRGRDAAHLARLAHVRAAPGPSVETTVASGTERRLGAQIRSERRQSANIGALGPTGAGASYLQAFPCSSSLWPAAGNRGVPGSSVRGHAERA
jgi:hypothetical protein